MANRYWVGGTGTWNTTSTTNWSASSGGASGASVPTAADSVFFDQAGTYTVTMTGALTCLDITVSAGTVTFNTGTSPTLSINGSMSLLAGTVWNSTGAITFNSPTTGQTITTNGVTITGAINFNGTTGAWTLGSALTTSGILTVNAGTFSTANYAVSASQLVSSSGATRAINLGSSTITLTSGVNFTNNAALTFNAGTSTIICNGTNCTITFGLAAGLTTITFYNISFTTTTASTHALSAGGVGTYTSVIANNISVTAPSTAGVTTVTIVPPITINGTLSTTGTAGNRRVFFASATYGISVDLAVNASPSLTDADFRGIYVTGSAKPISGTRIGNRGECSGITFDTPKTVYKTSGSTNWSGDTWATSSGGLANTNNFPLPQDTAVIDNTNPSVGGSFTLDAAIAYVPNVDFSTRTNSVIVTINTTTVYGNWTNGSGVTFAGTSTLTFSGGGTQTITSAGKTFTGPITVNTYGGTVQLGDALNIGANTLTVTNGTFDTKNFNVTASILSSSNSNVRTITLGSSTITLNTVGNLDFTTSTNLTFNSGASTIISSSSNGTINGGNQTFYNLTFSGSGTGNTATITGTNTFNNISMTGPALSGQMIFAFSGNQTINGTLTCAGISAVRRIFLRSDTLGTQRDLTVGTLSANDCDFRDIEILGGAAGTAPTRAGDCGGNSGITFPAAKTVYWNLAGAQNWSATGWATSSGGAPAVNNFPLAQDTAVFDNTGSVTGTITVDAAWNIGTFDASSRTSAMTISFGLPTVYGNWTFGTGVTATGAGGITFSKPGTQTITSNGVQFGCNVTVNHPSGTVQLADALSLNSARTLTLTAGTFDAVTYNVTTGLFSNGSTANTVKMGSGTWTISGTGTVWNCGTTPTLIAGTSTIVFSDTSTATRTMNPGTSRYYNKITIGGTTGTSSFIFTTGITVGELASTKTVAHTIQFPTIASNIIGKWSVTGTLGNVVTLQSATSGTAFNLLIYGQANSGIDYLSIRDCTLAATSPGEFYAGANSTNVSGNTRVIFTATPTPRTLYWVGGTGNWSDTARWSTSSGGPSGAAIPTSLDAVNFDSASNATAYTATIDAGVTIARCASFTMAGPASGNVTFAGTVAISFNGNVSFAATGITRTYTGTIFLNGSGSHTFTTNGVSFASQVSTYGILATWELGSAFTSTSVIDVSFGSFSTSASNYALTLTNISSFNINVRTISLNGSSVTLTSGGVTFSQQTNLTFNAGTSNISMSSSFPDVTSVSGVTFYNVSFTNTAPTSITISGVNTFNNLTFTGRTSVGLTPATFSANQTINGTLTLGAGTAAAYRTFLASNTIGTTRTLTVNSLAAGAADIDFRDITIAGAAAPISGTRFGDAKGNSGITFPAAKTVYYRQTGSANWGATGTGSWSATSGGALDATQFPLAQDTAIFPAATYPASGSTTTINANYNIGTIDMSLRTANTMTLAMGATTPQIYGNWINGTGISQTSTGTITFAGRGSQTITSAAKTFAPRIVINTPGGSVTLQDALTVNYGASNAINHIAGTFDASLYNVTLANNSDGITSNSGFTRTLAVGSGTWTIAGSGPWTLNIITNLTVTGTGTISLTSASAKTFEGGGANYSGITINQGGAGALTINGNNTFKNITNTYSATGAATISLNNTTTTLTQFTGTGAAAKLLTLSGTSAASPATLILSSGTVTTPDYLSISNVRAYNLSSTWYAGANSTNLGSLGWIFAASGGVTYNSTITETATGTDEVSSSFLFLGSISETATATDEVSSLAVFLSTASETATATDAVDASGSTYNPTITETSTATDTISVSATFESSISELPSITDSVSAAFAFFSTVTETTTASDAVSSLMAFASSVAESSTATDAVSSLAAFASSIAETSTSTDTISALGSFGSVITETATATDSSVGYITFPASIAETLTSTDTVVGYITFPASVAESLSASDLTSSVFAVSAFVSETVTSTDSVSTTAIFISAVSETSTSTDTITANSSFGSAVLESATITDTTSAAATFAPAISETATSTDSVSVLASFASVIAESSTATDATVGYITFPASIAETGTATDSTSSVPVYLTTILESATATDATSALAAFGGTILESATATDAVSPPGSTYNPSIAETSTASDSVVGYLVFPATIVESATSTDQADAFMVFVGSVSESATGTDAVSAAQLFSSIIEEVGTAADSITVAPSVFNAPVVELVTGTDATRGTAIFPNYITETISITDLVIGAYLWNPINDDQTANWAPVNDSQTVTWTAVNDSQTVSWQNVDNSQSSGWVDVDDQQTPGWNPTLS